MSEASDSEGDAWGIFEEPHDYYPPAAKSTTVVHTTLSGQTLPLGLVGHSPLWGHLLWNAGRTTADYLERNASTCIHGKTVLELGAGAGLPSLICALNGAKRVVVTDYPDVELIDNLRQNIAACDFPNPHDICAEGYLWGTDATRLTCHLPQTERKDAFDLLILADVLFNHSEHPKLLSTVQRTLKRTTDSQALVFFTPYRPWLLQKDLAFFTLAQAGGFTAEKIFEQVLEDVMFENDPGDETLRKTVFGYSLKWADTY